MCALLSRFPEENDAHGGGGEGQHAQVGPRYCIVAVRGCPLGLFVCVCVCARCGFECVPVAGRRSHPALPSPYQVPTTKLRKQFIWSLRSEQLGSPSPRPSGQPWWLRLHNGTPSPALTSTSRYMSKGATASVSTHKGAAPPAPGHQQHSQKEAEEEEDEDASSGGSSCGLDLSTSSDEEEVKQPRSRRPVDPDHLVHRG